MDSITQMVLGAACGEAALGKKIGNKALIWGAVAGTIPDLDVLSNFFMNDLDALAFHRGPMHSLIFACVMPFLLAFLVLKFYKSKLVKNIKYKWIVYLLSCLLFLLIGFLYSLLLIFIVGKIGWFLPIILSVGLFFLFRFMYFDYLKKEQIESTATYKDWVWLFFISIVTHPLLDSFTTFGTQLLWPFFNHRFGLSNISILDPIYTLPFLGTVIACGFLDRNDRRRRYTNWIGIGISSLYMMGTLITKQHVDKVLTYSFAQQNIVVDQSLSTPTILNNILWYNIGKKDSVYYCGYYSILDKKAIIDTFHMVPQNNYLLKEFEHHKTFKVLKWFSEEYYGLIDSGSNYIQYNDLRYGTMSFNFDDAKDFIFHFNLEKNNGDLIMHEDNRRPEQKKEDLIRFWERIKGK